MPLPPELRKGLDSEVADMLNTGPREGGMLTAGLFLQEFVTEGVRWAHLDIAGPAFNGGEPTATPHRRHRRGRAHLRPAARGPRTHPRRRPGSSPRRPRAGVSPPARPSGPAALRLAVHSRMREG
jgi:hypothetical protein